MHIDHGHSLPVLTDPAEQWVFDRIPPGRVRRIDSVNGLFFAQIRYREIISKEYLRFIGGNRLTQ